MWLVTIILDRAKSIFFLSRKFYLVRLTFSNRDQLHSRGMAWAGLGQIAELSRREGEGLPSGRNCETVLRGWSESESLGRHLGGENELEHRIPFEEPQKPSAWIPSVRMEGTRPSASSQFPAPDAILHTHSTPSGGKGSDWTLAPDLRGGAYWHHNSSHLLFLKRLLRMD